MQSDIKEIYDMKFVISINTPKEKEFTTLTKARKWIVANKPGNTTIYKVLKYGDEYIAGYVKMWNGKHVFYDWDGAWGWVINKDGTLGRKI